MLVDLRAVVEAALAKNAKDQAKPAAKARAHAAAAANSDVPDFEVSSHTPDWSENAPTGQPDTDHNDPK